MFLFVSNDIRSFFEEIIDNIKSKFINYFLKIIEIIVNILTVIGVTAGVILKIIVTIFIMSLALVAGVGKLIIKNNNIHSVGYCKTCVICVGCHWKYRCIVFLTFFFKFSKLFSQFQ